MHLLLLLSRALLLLLLLLRLLLWLRFYEGRLLAALRLRGRHQLL